MNCWCLVAYGPGKFLNVDNELERACNISLLYLNHTTLVVWYMCLPLVLFDSANESSSNEKWCMFSC